MKEKCEVQDRAKILAEKEGLDSKVIKCPAEYCCDGSMCIFDGQPVPDMGRIERFMLRLQRTAKLRGL